MASMKCKRAGVVAVLAASLTMMGGAAFASPAPTGYQEPVNPGGLLGGAYADVVTVIADNSHLM